MNEVQDKEFSYYLQGSGRDYRYIEAQTANSAESDTNMTQLIQGHKSVIGELDSDTESTKTLKPYRYTDYGTLLSTSEVVKTSDYNIETNPFKYGAEYEDRESGLYYLRARYYHPKLQSFPQRDSAQLMNRYQYANANPIMNIDPSGHMSARKAGLVEIIYGAAASIAGFILTAATGNYFWGNNLMINGGVSLFKGFHDTIYSGPDKSGSDMAKQAGLNFAIYTSGLLTEIYGNAALKQMMGVTGSKGTKNKIKKTAAFIGSQSAAAFLYNAQGITNAFRQDDAKQAGMLYANYIFTVLPIEMFLKPLSYKGMRKISSTIDNMTDAAERLNSQASLKK